MSLLARTNVSSDDVVDMLDKLGPILAREDERVVYVTLLALAITQQAKGHLTLEEIQEGVQGASQWIAAYVTDKAEKGLPN